MLLICGGFLRKKPSKNKRKPNNMKGAYSCILMPKHTVAITLKHQDRLEPMKKSEKASKKTSKVPNQGHQAFKTKQFFYQKASEKKKKKTPHLPTYSDYLTRPPPQTKHPNPTHRRPQAPGRRFHLGRGSFRASTKGLVHEGLSLLWSFG